MLDPRLPPETNPGPSNADAEETGRALPLTLSEQLWDIDWERALPHSFDDGFSAVRSSLARSADFIKEHYSTIFEESADSPFRTQLSSSKARFYELSDFVEFRREGRAVGLVISAPSDWSTYYVRSAALLPSVQGSAVIQRFFTRIIFPILAEAGVERVETDVSPSNTAMVHIVTRLSFNITGSLLTDRWGANTRFTKFLSRQSEGVFLNQFCSGVKYQLRDARHQAPVIEQKGER